MDELLSRIKDEDASSGLAVEGAACSGWNLLEASPVASLTWEDITELDADTLKQRGVTGILDETMELVEIDSDDEVELPFMHYKERATISSTPSASITGCTTTSTRSTTEQAESVSPYRTSGGYSTISGPPPEEEGEVGGVTVSSDSGVTGISVDGVSEDDMSASMAREPSAEVLLDSLRDTSSQHQPPDSAPSGGVVSLAAPGTSSPIMPGISELIAAQEERATVGSGRGLGKEQVGSSRALNNCEPTGKLGQDEEKLVADNKIEVIPRLGLEAIQTEFTAGGKEAGGAKDSWKNEMNKSQVLSADSASDIIDLKAYLLADFENDRQKEEAAGDVGGCHGDVGVSHEGIKIDTSPLDNVDAGSVGGDSGCCDDESVRNEAKSVNQTFTLDLLGGEEAVVGGVKGVALDKVFLDDKEESVDVAGIGIVGGVSKEVNELEKEMNMADQEVGLSSKKVGVASKKVGAISGDGVSLNSAKDILATRAENSNKSQQPVVAEGTEVKAAVAFKQVGSRQLVMPGAFKGGVKGRLQKTALPPVPVVGNIKSDISRTNKGLKVPSSKLPISKLPVASKQSAASKLPVTTSKLPTPNATTTVKLQAKLDSKKLNTLVMPSKTVGLPKVAVTSQSTSSRLIRPAARRGPLKAVQNNNLVKPSLRNTTVLIKPAPDSTRATKSQDAVNGPNAQPRFQVVTKGIPTAAAKTSADDLPNKSADAVDLAFSPTPLREGFAVTSTPCCRPPSDGALGQTQVISRPSSGPLRKNEAAPLPVVSPRDETDQKTELSKTVTKPRSSLGSTTPTSGGKRRSLIPTPQGRQFSPSDQHVTPLRANLQQAKKRLSVDANNDMSPQLTSEPCNTTRSIAYPQRKLGKSKVGTVRVGVSKKPFKPRNGGRGLVRPAPPQKVVQPTTVYEEDIFGQENDVPPPAKNCLMHSPLNKDDLPQTPHSKWSPIKRTQPGIDSCYRCTKVSRIRQ